MAKQQRTQKQTTVDHKNGNGYQQEHTEVFDDNLLPDATEIQKLKEMDPEIMTWLKARAEKEQDFRHAAFNHRTTILESDVKGSIRINAMGTIFAFIIIMSGMAFSAFLVHYGSIIAGTIFSGLTIVYAASLFLRKKRNMSNEK